MRLAMVRPGRERLSGSVVGLDETYWGAAESGGAVGRLTQSKSLIAVAAQLRWLFPGIGAYPPGLYSSHR